MKPVVTKELKEWIRKQQDRVEELRTSLAEGNMRLAGEILFSIKMENENKLNKLDLEAETIKQD